MTPPASPAKRLPASIWALGFVSLLMDVSSEMIHSLLPVFLVASLGVSMLAVGLIEGAAEATALVLKVFSGVLSDWWGRRKPLAVLGYGLGALSKPLFAISPTMGLVADLAPPGMRGAAFGLRQSLDTVGAFLGPLLAMGLMLLWANDFRAVFWVAVIPAALCVALLLVGVREPERAASAVRTNPIRRENLRRLGGAYWWVVALGAVFTLARFSEAFLVLRVQQGGLPLAWTPLVLVLMNVVFALGAYPLGKLADSTRHTTLLAWGLVVLIAADALLAFSDRGAVAWLGIALWGLHMAMTQGLLATMVADTAPADLRGTAFGMFNLVSGVALLVASGLAGLLWDRLGASATFGAGILFATLALAGVLVQSARHGRAPKPPATQG